MPAKIPRAQEIIFRSGAVDRRRVLPIDEEHVVAFAPPAVLILQHRHGHADKVAAPGRFHPDVVAFAIQILFVVDHRIAVRLPLIAPSFRRSFLAVLRVEVKLIRGQRLAVSAVVDVEVETRRS